MSSWLDDLGDYFKAKLARTVYAALSGLAGLFLAVAALLYAYWSDDLDLLYRLGISATGIVAGVGLTASLLWYKMHNEKLITEDGPDMGCNKN